MTVSCCVLGHLAHNVSESDVCSFFDAWCLCFACCFDSHSRFSKDLLYCCHVQCSQIYARGLNFSSQKVSALLFMAGAAPARSFFSFPSREMSPTGNILKVLWSLAVLLSHMCLRGLMICALPTLPTRAFLLTSVGDGKSYKEWKLNSLCTEELYSKWGDHIQTRLNKIQMKSRGF